MGMVDIVFINKSLDDAIQKCSKPSYSLMNLSNRIKHSLNVFAETIRELDYEKGCLIDNKGNVVYENTDHSNKTVHLNQTDYLEELMMNDHHIREWVDNLEKETEEIYNSTDDIGEAYSKSTKLEEEYTKNLIQYLTENGNFQINIEHNHPGAYGNNDDTNVPLDYNVFTCLSEGDVNCLLGGVEVYGENYKSSGIYVNGLVRSITAECSNGSRMSLINNNPIDTNIDTEQFINVYNNLNNKWKTYLKEIREKGINYSNQEKYIKYHKEHPNEKLLDFIHNDKNNYMKKESLKIFPSMISDDIKAFEELGFELRVDWL